LCSRDGFTIRLRRDKLAWTISTGESDGRRQTHTLSKKRSDFKPEEQETTRSNWQE
jgi:hypothetical protein